MRDKKSAVLGVICTPWVAADATAQPQLLRSFSWSTSGGHSPCSVGRAEFYLEHHSQEFTHIVRLGEGLAFWKDGASGSVDFTPDTSVAFEAFAALPADGASDYLFLLDGIEGCVSGGGNGFPGSFALAGTPDLVGEELDFIRLIVHDVNIEQSGVGVLWRADLTYEFWGAPIPEPATACLLAHWWRIGLPPPALRNG